MKICYAEGMKQVLTAKLKLQTSPEQFQVLRKTQLAYREALNYVSHYAYAHGKLANKVALQAGTYTKLRSQFRIPAQMACSIPRQVGATYKTLWKRLKQNQAARQARKTKKRYKGLDQPPKYVSPTLTYQYGHDYGFKADSQISILTLQGRLIVPYTCYSRHAALIQHGAHIGAAKLWYDKPRKQFYLLVSLELEVADPTPHTHTSVVGVDVGQRYLAVTTDTRDHVTFYSGKAVRAKADHYARVRKRLQHKGTRSAMHRLVAISGRERRFKQSVNHTIARRIVQDHPHSLIGLEDLTHIRDRTTRQKGKQASKKQRRTNRHASSWAFAELHAFLAYKAVLAGSMTVKVDAYCTSQACPRCGYSQPENRPHKGLLFACRACGYTLHSDLVGSRNITLRTLVIRQDWMTTGYLSTSPDASDDEAKAASRQRFVELRWSLDTSSLSLGGGC